MLIDYLGNQLLYFGRCYEKIMTSLMYTGSHLHGEFVTQRNLLDISGIQCIYYVELVERITSLAMSVK